MTQQASAATSQQSSLNQSLLNQPETLSALLAVLEQETRQLEATCDQLNIKRQILVAGKPDELLAIDRELLTLGKKATELAREREQLTLTLGCQQETLKSMITRMPAQFVPRFMMTRNQLQRAALDMTRLNREVQDLLNLSLKWVQDTVDVIASAMNPEGSSYTPKGSKTNRQATPHHPTPSQSTIIHDA